MFSVNSSLLITSEFSIAKWRAHDIIMLFLEVKVMTQVLI
jgi:hypothetical protein